MKKEIERIKEEYKDVLNGKEVYLEIEKSDPLDNRSPRRYRLWVVLGWKTNNELDIICEVGFCKNKEDIIKRFENKLKERRS
jgi:hypothetical protein